MDINHLKMLTTQGESDTIEFKVIFRFKEPIGGYITKRPFEPTPRQHEILTLLEKSTLNGAQIAEKLKDAPSLRTIQVDLGQLEKMG